MNDFGLVWATSDHFRLFLIVLDNFDDFNPFWTISNHFRPFMVETVETAVTVITVETVETAENPVTFATQKPPALFCYELGYISVV